MSESATRSFFVVATALTAALGLGWLAAPAFMLDQWGVPDADAATAGSAPDRRRYSRT